MEIEIQEDVQELLIELNEIGRSVIFGGYLRDRYYGLLPSDVDIATNIPMDIIESKYGHMEKAKRRMTDSGHEVFSFKMHKREKVFVEIVSTDIDVMDKSNQADYTINSLMHDGNELFDLNNGVNDLKNRQINEVKENVIEHDLTIRPYLWLKTLRLVSMTGGNLSDKVRQVLEKNKHYLLEISDEIMQTEGHKTLNGKHALKAFYYLGKMGLVASIDEKWVLSKEKEYFIQPAQKLCLLAILVKKEAVDDYIQLYRFPYSLIEKYEKLYEMYHSEGEIPNKWRHQIHTIKKILT